MQQKTSIGFWNNKNINDQIGGLFKDQNFLTANSFLFSVHFQALREENFELLGWVLAKKAALYLLVNELKNAFDEFSNSRLEKYKYNWNREDYYYFFQLILLDISIVPQIKPIYKNEMEKQSFLEALLYLRERKYKPIDVILKILEVDASEVLKDMETFKKIPNNGVSIPPNGFTA